MCVLRQAGAAAVVAALAAIAACGAGSSSSAPGRHPISKAVSGPSTQPPSRPISASPSPSPSSSGRFRQAYLNGFEDFFLAYARADEGADPASAELGQFATGQALAWARMQVSVHKKLGVAHEGEYHFKDVGAVDVTASSAEVGQCMDWSTWPVVNRTTKVALQRFPQWFQLVYAHMVLLDGRWKASTVRVQAAAC